MIHVNLGVHDDPVHATHLFQYLLGILKQFDSDPTLAILFVDVVNVFKRRLACLVVQMRMNDKHNVANQLLVHPAHDTAQHSCIT